MSTFFSTKNLVTTVDDKIILNGVNLDIEPGSIHALMGPNGSGKSTLANTIMGHPRYKITQGTISFLNAIINALPTNKRAQTGLFLTFQNAPEIEGVVFKDLLRQSYKALYDNTDKKLNIKEFNQHLATQMQLLGMDKTMIQRSVNAGFSGGEKKRAEMLQLAVLQPKLAILDEIDSGLDIDALKTICQALLTIKKQLPEMALLIITHNLKVFDYLNPDVVHIFKKGTIVKSGDKKLIHELEKKGYDD